MKGSCMMWGTSIAVAAIAALWLFWTHNFPTYSYNFRMTVAVETPEGVKTGSSVYSISAGKRPKLTAEEGSRSMVIKGEAVAVDLPDDKILFALLKTDSGSLSRLSMKALDPSFVSNGYDTVASARRLGSRKGVEENAVVPPEDYPILVTFADIDDPKSIELVDPNDLAASFSEGYVLISITVELTDDPVTTGIEERFLWWSEVKGSLVRFDLQNRPPAGTPPPFGTRITKRDFSIGVAK